ncbi:unnamed protein product [Gordionus sp. m RMFG-2023]
MVLNMWSDPNKKQFIIETLGLFKQNQITHHPSKNFIYHNNLSQVKFKSNYLVNSNRFQIVEDLKAHNYTMKLVFNDTDPSSSENDSRRHFWSSKKRNYVLSKRGNVYNAKYWDYLFGVRCI